MATKTKTPTAAVMRNAEALAEVALELEARVGQLNEQLVIAKASLAMLPVGTVVTTSLGKVTVTNRESIKADVDVLKGVASRRLFPEITETKFAIGKYRAAVLLGRVPQAVQDVVQDTVGAPYAILTLATK